MIFSLNGTLVSKSIDSVVVVCCGVGYNAVCSANTLSMMPSVGDDVHIFTVLSVKENAVELYGFASEKERDAFKLLCSVSGVGPKLALSVLSTYDPDRVALLIASGDSKAVTACPGVGARIAQRIVLELKDKILQLNIKSIGDVVAPVTNGSNTSDALAALVSLGFSNSEAASALSSLSPELPVEELISSALRTLSKVK